MRIPTLTRECPASRPAGPSDEGPTFSPWALLLAGAGFMAMASAGALLVLGMTTMVSAANAATAAEPAPERQRELIHLVRQECGFCHGLRLTGGLGSPLTAPAMAEKPAETLEAVILHGIPGTAMPPWRPFLSDADVSWIVHRLQEGFPHDSR